MRFEKFSKIKYGFIFFHLFFLASSCLQNNSSENNKSTPESLSRSEKQKISKADIIATSDQSYLVDQIIIKAGNQIDKSRVAKMTGKSDIGYEKGEIYLVGFAKTKKIATGNSSDNELNLSGYFGKKVGQKLKNKKIAKIDKSQIDNLSIKDISTGKSFKNKVPEEAIVEPGTIVYRGMEIRSEYDILMNGMDAPVIHLKRWMPSHKQIVSKKGPITSIRRHQNELHENSRSIFISTSKSKEVAMDFSGKDGIVFKIKTPENKAIDVNKAYGNKNFEGEKEIAIIGSLHKDNIIGYYRRNLSNRFEYFCILDC